MDSAGIDLYVRFKTLLETSFRKSVIIKIVRARDVNVK